MPPDFMLTYRSAHTSISVSYSTRLAFWTPISASRTGASKGFTPTAYINGAKTAPGYIRAKAVIKYINELGKMISADPEMADKMRVVFVQNYNCSYAEHIVSAADVSEQISPAAPRPTARGNMEAHAQRRGHARHI